MMFLESKIYLCKVLEKSSEREVSNLVSWFSRLSGITPFLLWRSSAMGWAPFALLMALIVKAYSVSEEEERAV